MDLKGTLPGRVLCPGRNLSYNLTELETHSGLRWGSDRTGPARAQIHFLLTFCVLRDPAIIRSILLKIPQSELDALRRHGEQTYPHECCGVLLGRIAGDTRIAERAIACANTQAERGHDRYHIDPRDLVRLQRAGRAQGLDLVGFYHSHPDWPARWSATDLAEAHWLGCSYVITRVAQGCAQDTNSFVLAGASEDDKHFEPEALAAAAPSDVTFAHQRMSC